VPRGPNGQEEAALTLGQRKEKQQRIEKIGKWRQKIQEQREPTPTVAKTTAGLPVAANRERGQIRQRRKLRGKRTRELGRGVIRV
jgi:hypothetical protein